jgi:hypothetical protein
MNFIRVTDLELTLITAENDGLLADSHIITNKWKNYFCQLLN